MKKQQKIQCLKMDSSHSQWGLYQFTCHILALDSAIEKNTNEPRHEISINMAF